MILISTPQELFAAMKKTVAQATDVMKPYGKMTMEELMANGGHFLVNMALCEFSYSEYLKTEHWKTVKDRAFQIHGKRCFVCGSIRDVEVHHILYCRGEEKPEEVFPLCHEHHMIQHKILLEIAQSRGKKVTE